MVHEIKSRFGSRLRVMMVLSPYKVTTSLVIQIITYN